MGTHKLAALVFSSLLPASVILAQNSAGSAGGIVPAAVVQPSIQNGVEVPSTAVQSAPVQENDAIALLRAMSNYVSSQQTIELTLDSDLEIISPQLEKIQFASSGELLLSRPDKLRAHRVGGFADVLLYFDGKTVNIHGKNINGYTQFDAPGTVDQLIATLRAGGVVSLPGGDLLLSNAYEVLVAGVMEAKYLGRGVIDGIETEHLAFRNFDTDWQLWVEVGDRPIPRKMVITSKTVNGAPQYTLRIKKWKTGVTPAADAFVFTPPAGAHKISPDALLELGEMPHGAQTGGIK